MKKWHRKLLALSLCLSLALSGCTPAVEKSTQTPPASSAPGASQSQTPPAQKEHPTLNLVSMAEITQLDPHVSNGADYNIFSSIFDGLVKFDGANQMAVKPSLAKSWDISDDQMEFIFYLVETNWHDGTPFTADDVVFSVQRLQTQPATASKVLMIKGAEAIDEHTVKITCNYAYPNLILQMASWPWRMVSKKVVEAKGDGNKDMVVGTGPYKLDSWTTGVGVTLKANEDYFGGAPYFETVNIKIMTDNTTIMTALENGEIDTAPITNGLDADYIRTNDKFVLNEVKRSGAYTVIFNTAANKALADQKVRQAFCYALNRKDLIDLVYDGEAFDGCYSVIGEGEEGYNPDVTRYDYDVQKAKDLLAEAGYGSGLTLKFTYPTIDVGERLAAALKESLRQVGITLELVPMEYSAYLMAGYTGDYETIYMEWQSIPYNPPLFYNLYFISTGSLNYARINNPEIDQKALAAAKELDNAKRAAIYKELNALVRDQAYYATIAYIKTNVAQNAHIKGITYEPNTMITHYSDWYWE